MQHHPTSDDPNAADQPGAGTENADATGQEAAAETPSGPSQNDEVDAAPDADALAAEVADLKDKLLRAVAELENFRRRAERERTDAARYGAATFARDMIGVADNLRRAIETLPAEARAEAPEAARNLIEGVEVTERMLLSAFERHGIAPVAPKEGDKFDPHLHEAMFEVPGSGQPAGTIVQTVETGYMIGDRLLRAAKVGVAKNDGGAGDEGGSGAHVDTQA